MEVSMYQLFGGVPVSAGVLRSALPGLRAPQARLALLQQRGELIPLRRDLYVCSDGRGVVPGRADTGEGAYHQVFLPGAWQAIRECYRGV